MKWVDGVNYGMLGVDVGYGVYVVGIVVIVVGVIGVVVVGVVVLVVVFVVVVLGGVWLFGKIGVIGVVEKGVEWFGDKLGLSIGKGDLYLVCVGDDIVYLLGFWGMVVGFVIGVVIGVVVVVMVVIGGLVGVVIVGVCMVGGLSFGSGLVVVSQSMGSNCGKIVFGLGNVIFEGKVVVCVMDIIVCDKYFGFELLVEGSFIIIINQLLFVCIGYLSYCSGKVNFGCKSVLIDKIIGQFGLKNFELIVGEEFFVGFVGGLFGVKLGGMIGGRVLGELNKLVECDGVKDEIVINCKDLIDVVIGEMVEICIDVLIFGVLFLVFMCCYCMCLDDEGLFGLRWLMNWLQCLWLDEGCFVCFFDGGGLMIIFEVFDVDFNGINLCELCYCLEGM